MKYWIYDGSAERGPYTLDQLRQLGVTTSTPVWREGLSDWCRADLLPELRPLWQPAPDCTVKVESSQVEDIQIDQPAPQPPVQPTTPPELPDGAAHTNMYGFQQPVQPQYANPMEPVQPQGEPCPPTHLAWAIAATVLCCVPLGIVAIVMSLQVEKRYNRGDLASAKRASEATDWWIIGSIVLGILTAPLAMLVM